MKIDIGETTGIVRELDDLGRIVLPKTYRNTLNLKDGDKVEIFLAKNYIIIKKGEE